MPFLAAAVAGALLAPAPARATKLLTYETPSRFVDPSNAPEGSYNHPPGVPARPNALRVNVLLPDGYSRRSRRGYPLLLLLHGQGDAYDSWAHSQRGNVGEIARGFPGVVAMPEADRGFYANWWNGGARGDPQWERYHLDELVPFLERRLRIRKGRRWHAIAGLSMGGQGGALYAARRPGYFGSVAVFSAPLSIQRSTYQAGFPLIEPRAERIYGDPEEQSFYWAGHNPLRLVDNLTHTRIYVSAGDGVPRSPDEGTNTTGAVVEAELRQHAQEFVPAARAAGADVTYTPHQGIHDWPYWRRDLAGAIRWGPFEPVPERSTAWTYRTVSQFGRMWGLRFGFAEPPGEVVTFRRKGRTLTATGSGRVTIRVLGAGRRGRFTASLPFKRRLVAPRRRPGRKGKKGRSRFSVPGRPYRGGRWRSERPRPSSRPSPSRPLPPARRAP